MGLQHSELQSYQCSDIVRRWTEQKFKAYSGATGCRARSKAPTRQPLPNEVPAISCFVFTFLTPELPNSCNLCNFLHEGAELRKRLSDVLSCACDSSYNHRHIKPTHLLDWLWPKRESHQFDGTAFSSQSKFAALHSAGNKATAIERDILILVSHFSAFRPHAWEKRKSSSAAHQLPAISCWPLLPPPPEKLICSATLISQQRSR